MLSVSLNHKVSPFQVVMKGYLKNPEGTAEAFEGGWFHTGDLGVRYPDGYIALKDRAKDIIISGGENISSVEIEAELFSHPMILEAAVVAKADARWGETPVCLKRSSIDDFYANRFHFKKNLDSARSLRCVRTGRFRLRT